MTQKWARTHNGLVVEVIDIDPEGRYHPDIVWVECPAEVQQHWVYEGGTFIAPPLPPEPEPEPE